MRKQLLALTTSLVFAGCGGGGGGSASTGPVPLPTATPSPITVSNGMLYPVFTLSMGVSGSSTQRSPQYISNALQSAVIALIAVNGAPPAAGLVTSATTNLTSTTCLNGCRVNAPASPPGTDTYTFTTYMGPNGTGSPLATSTQSFTFTPGSSNPNGAIMLKGIPARVTLGAVTPPSAGTRSSQPLSVSALDASGQTITGTYSTPVTLTDSDTSGASGSELSVNGGAAGNSITIASSTDVATLVYGGGPLSNVVLSASASGATGATMPVQANASPIVYSGPFYNGSPEVDLYATSGTGSSGNVSFSELGYSGAPYNNVFTASASAGCANIATVSPATGTSFTIHAAAAPAAGSCTMSFADASGQTSSVTVTYTTWTVGIQ